MPKLALALASTNDTIAAMIFSEKDYNAWRNGDDVKAYYETGNLTRSPLYTKLPSDESFYLVFDNSMHKASS